jgi:hypothetical protein
MARFLRAALGLVLMPLVLAACGNPTQPVGTYPTYRFTCCTGSDIKQVWHPGQTVDLHWNVEAGPLTADNAAHSLVISAALNGPFADVATLKKTGGGSSGIQGPAIKTNDRTATAPVMSFVLPADLPAGFYNLTIKWDSGGGNWWSGGSVVQVGP